MAKENSLKQACGHTCAWLKRSYTSFNAFEKVLVCSLLAFGGVCAGGLLVAYGGTLLMLWLALLVQAGLIWLIAKTSKIAFVDSAPGIKHCGKRFWLRRYWGCLFLP